MLYRLQSHDVLSTLYEVNREPLCVSGAESDRMTFQLAAQFQFKLSTRSKIVIKIRSWLQNQFILDFYDSYEEFINVNY